MRYKNLKHLVFVAFFLLSFFVGVKLIYAEEGVCCCKGTPVPSVKQPECGNKGAGYGACEWMDKNKCGQQGNNNSNPPPSPPIKLTDPLGIGGRSDVPAGQEVQFLIGRIIKVIMGLVGSIALLMFVYGGFLWMTAAGNDEKVSKGKDILIWAVAGLAVIFSSYILVYFVLASLMGLG